MKDYYAILGVKPGDGYDVIKAAYRSLALHTHPDKGNSNEVGVFTNQGTIIYHLLVLSGNS